jgi:hypothetical protein
MKMDATFNTTRAKVRTMNQHYNSVSRAMIHINDIKYDLLKIAEMYDGILQDGLGHMAADMFQNYLSDLRADRWIYGYEITEVVLKEQSYTYDVSIQITGDRTPKKLKIHVGLYKSAWPDLAASMQYTGTGYVAK